MIGSPKNFGWVFKTYTSKTHIMRAKNSRIATRLIKPFLGFRALKPTALISLLSAINKALSFWKSCEIKVTEFCKKTFLALITVSKVLIPAKSNTILSFGTPAFTKAFCIKRGSL